MRHNPPGWQERKWCGRISNRGDYDTVVDLFSDERLAADQRQRLSTLIASYEQRAIKPRR